MSDTPITDRYILARSSTMIEKMRELERELSALKSLRPINERLRMILRSVNKRNRTLEKQAEKAHNKAIYADVDVVHLQREVERLREALGEACDELMWYEKHTGRRENLPYINRWRDLASGKESV